MDYLKLPNKKAATSFEEGLLLVFSGYLNLAQIVKRK